MADKIQGLFIDPPIAIARLGASTKPVDCFHWQDADDPHLQTVIGPAWTLDVESDGSVVPRMPDQLRFRDGALIRPVAPFFEVWALVGADNIPRSQLTETPLTPALLQDNGVDSLTLTVDARNAKAAHRADLAGLVFGTFPPVVVDWNDQRSIPLVATSPPGLERPMIPPGSPGIPLGRVQMLRSQKQPQSLEPWIKDVNVEVIRFRFTPATGEFYGPTGSADIRLPGTNFTPVRPENAFLDPNAGWRGVRNTPSVEPADTFDGVESPGNRSIGIVDDTCTANLEIKLVLKAARGAARTFAGRAHVMVGPPHFAPDRRPFLSLADELIDRSYQGRIGTAPDDEWVRDLFERVYETASLINLDLRRAERAARLASNELSRSPMKDDGVLPADVAMGSRDLLRVPDEPIQGPLPKVPLPLTQRAINRHRNLAELEELRTLILRNRDRLKELVRPPFHVGPSENAGQTTMQMPPFMRNSNAYPLTLAAWQYDLLFKWVDQVIAAAKRPTAAFSPAAARRRERVLTRLRSNHAVKP